MPEPERRPVAVSNPITYRELDTLLLGAGFTSASLPGGQIVYQDGQGDVIFAFHDLQPSETVRPHHLAAVRRWFLDTGIMTEAEFDAWLCQLRIADVRDEPVAAAAGRTTERAQ